MFLFIRDVERHIFTTRPGLCLSNSSIKVDLDAITFITWIVELRNIKCRQHQILSRCKMASFHTPSFWPICKVANTAFLSFLPFFVFFCNFFVFFCLFLYFSFLPFCIFAFMSFAKFSHAELLANL